MIELDILGKYLAGEKTYLSTLDRIIALIEESDEKTKYSSLVRCIKAFEKDEFYDFCGHLRQTLGVFNGPVVVSKELYRRIYLIKPGLVL